MQKRLQQLYINNKKQINTVIILFGLIVFASIIAIASNSNWYRNIEKKLGIERVYPYFDFSVPDTLDSPLVINKNNFSLKIQPADASTSEVINSGKNVFVYKNAYENTDLVYTRNNNTVKEDIILKSKVHPDSFSYYLDLSELDYLIKEDKSIEFYQKLHTGDPMYLLFTMPAPYMVDSNKKKSIDIQISIITLPAGDIFTHILTLIPNQDYLLLY